MVYAHIVPLEREARGFLTFPRRHQSSPGSATYVGSTGAGNGIRTRDPQLGKLMLYHLSYIRSVLENYTFLFNLSSKISCHV